MMSQLPLAVRLAWDVPMGPRRGPRPSLTTGQVVAAAVAVADAQGLEGVSLQSVAEPLGVVSTALYRYVDSKETLIELCVDAAIGTPPAEISAAAGWRERVHRWCSATAGLYRDHPWLLDVQVTGLPVLPNNLSWMERLLATLVDSPIDPTLRADAVLLIQGHVHHMSTLARSLRSSPSRPDEASYLEVLRTVVPRDRYPAVTEMMLGPENGSVDGVGHTRDLAAGLDLAVGIDIILDGLRHSGAES